MDVATLPIALIGNIALLVSVLVLVLIGALKGLFGGVQRMVIRFATIILSLVIAIIIAKVVGNSIINSLDMQTVEDLMATLAAQGVDTSQFSFINNFDVATYQYILALPVSLLFVPWIFTTSFIIISGLMMILHVVLCGILGFKKDDLNPLQKWLGFGVGALQGLIVAIIVSIPILGLAGMAEATVDTLREGENPTESETQMIEVYDTVLEGVTEGPVVKTMNFCGGKLLYRFLTSPKIEDDSVSIPDQVPTVVEAYLEYENNLTGADFRKLTPENKQGIKNIIAILDASDYFSPLLANVVKGAALTIAEGEMVTEMEEPIKSLFITLLDIFKTSDKTNICTDLNTFCDLYFLLSDTGILSAMNGEEGGGSPDMIKLLGEKDESGKTVLSRAIDVLSANERTKPIVSSLTKLSITMLGSAMSPDEQKEMEEVYDQVKSGLNEVVQVKREDYATDEEHKEAVADSLEQVLINNSILTDEFVAENRAEVDEVLSEVSDHIIENLAGTDEVTDEHITGIILEYYDAYINGDLNDLIGGSGGAAPAP